MADATAQGSAIESTVVKTTKSRLSCRSRPSPQHVDHYRMLYCGSFALVKYRPRSSHRLGRFAEILAQGKWPIIDKSWQISSDGALRRGVICDQETGMFR